MKRYYHGSDLIDWQYIRVPLVLLRSPDYKGKLNSDAILLYSILANRLNLSLENAWLDENNRAFIFFTREEMAEEMGLSQSTINKLIKKLRELELLEEKRQGLNKPNRIYLLKPKVEQVEEAFSDDGELDSKNVMCPSENKSSSSKTEYEISGSVNSTGQETRKCNFDRSGSVNSTGQDPLKLHPKKKYSRNKYINNSSPSSSPPEDTAQIREKVKKMIEYDALLTMMEPKLLDYLVEIILNVLTCKNNMSRIGKDWYPTEDVKNIFKSITRESVLHVQDAINASEKIINMQSFIISVLYNYQKNPIKKPTNVKPKNSFHDFEQRTYDDDFYKQIMEVQGL